MFLHLFIGDLQLTPTAFRGVRNVKSLQLVKLEVVHENQLTEYGLLSKDPKFDALFPFNQTIHIPLDPYMQDVPDSTDDDHNNPHLQRLSFAIFAVVGQQEQLIKLGYGVATSAKSEKQITKTVILRNDKFELIGRISITTFFNASLIDMTDFVQFKKKSNKSQDDQEYSFLLSRKFRRSEADFPSTFDKGLEGKLIEESEYYIHHLHPPKKDDYIHRPKSQPKMTRKSPELRRPTSNSKMSSTRLSAREEQLKRAYSTPKNAPPTTQSKPPVPLTSRSSSSGGRFPSPKHQHLIQAAVQEPKVRKTVMSVGYVHNAWPDPHENEKAKKEFQLKMANERKRQLLKQIAEEIEYAKQRKVYHQQLQANLGRPIEAIHQQKLLKEKEKEEKQKQKLTKELKHREEEIKHLQDKLRDIRMQSIIANHYQQASPPPKYQQTPSTQRAKSPISNGKLKSETTKPKLKSTPAAKLVHRHASPQVDRSSGNLNHLLEHHYGNFFKSPMPKPPVPTQKKKKEKVKKSSKASHKKASAKKSSQTSAARKTDEDNDHDDLSEDDSPKQAHQVDGNNVIQVSVKRGSVSAKYNRYYDRSEDDVFFQEFQKLEKEREKELQQQANKSPEFEFHDIYQKEKHGQEFNSDSPFLEMNASMRRQSLNTTATNTNESTARKLQDELNEQEQEKEELDEDEDEDEESDYVDESGDMLLSSPMRGHEDDEEDIQEFDTSLANEIKAQNEEFKELIYQSIETNQQKFDKAPRESFKEETNKKNLNTSEISIDSSADSYKVPGFLQSMIQTSTTGASLESLQSKANDLLDRIQETLDNSKLNEEEDEDDEPENDMSKSNGMENMDDDEFEAKFHLNTEDSNSSTDSDGNEPTFSNAMNQADEEEEELFLPMKDMNYQDRSFPFKKPQSSEEGTSSSGSSSAGSGDASSEDERKDKRKQQMKAPLDDHDDDEEEEEEDNKNLPLEDKYDFRYTAQQRTGRSHFIEEKSNKHYPSTRPKSKEKILQQFEKNRQYSKGTNSTVTAGSAVSTSSRLSDEDILYSSDGNNLTRNLLKFEQRQLRQREEEERQDEDEVAAKQSSADADEITYSQVDEMIAAANRAIDDVLSGKFDEAQREWKEQTESHKSYAKQQTNSDSDDSSMLSEEDTVENNVMDTLSFNENLTNFSSSSRDSNDIPSSEESRSEKKKKEDELPAAENEDGKNQFDFAHTDIPGKSSEFAKEPFQQEGKVADSFDQILRGKSDSFHEDFNDKLGRISQRINSLLSESNPNLTNLLINEDELNALKIHSSDLNNKKSTEEIISTKESDKLPSIPPSEPVSVVFPPPAPVETAHPEEKKVEESSVPELSPLIQSSKMNTITPSSEKKSVTFRSEVISSVHEIQSNTKEQEEGAEGADPVFSSTNQSSTLPPRNAAPNNANGNYHTTNGAIDYSKQTVSSRSLIERQFEKNRKYSSSLKKLENSLGTNKSPTAAETAKAALAEFPAVSQDPVSEIKQATPVAEPKDSKPIEVLSPKESGPIMKSASSDDNQPDLDKYTPGRRASEGKVKAIISQFEKNKRYNNNNNNNNNNSDSLAGSLSPTGRSADNSAFPLPLMASPTSSSPARAKAGTSSNSNSPQRNKSLKEEMHSDWDAFGQALDKLESRVKSIDTSPFSSSPKSSGLESAAISLDSELKSSVLEEKKAVLDDDDDASPVQQRSSFSERRRSTKEEIEELLKTKKDSSFFSESDDGRAELSRTSLLDSEGGDEDLDDDDDAEERARFHKILNAISDSDSEHEQEAEEKRKRKVLDSI